MPRPDRDMGRAGGDPVNRRGPSARIAPVVDHREEDSSSGRVLPHARQRQRPRRRVLEMVPTLSTRAERGGQVVLNVAHFSIPPAHQAW